MFKFAGITKKGVELLAEASDGKVFKFTRMEYGDGFHEGLKNIVSDADTIEKWKKGLVETLETAETKKKVKELFLDVVGLVSKRADIGIYSTSTDSNITTVVGKLLHSSIIQNFNARELGVFAKVDEGEEKLLQIFQQ